MRTWFLRKNNIYALFGALLVLIALLCSVLGPLTFANTLDPKSLEKLLQPTYLECISTLKEGGVISKEAGTTCQENSIRQILQKVALFIFASPLVLLNVRKEIMEAPKARAQRLGAFEVTNALERMEKIANLAILLAVPLAVFLFARVVQPFDTVVFGKTIAWVLMLASISISFYIAALLTGLIATGFMPSDSSSTLTAQPTAATSSNAGTSPGSSGTP